MSAETELADALYGAAESAPWLSPFQFWGFLTIAVILLVWGLGGNHTKKY